MLWQALSAVRDLGRLHDIAAVLVRHGFGDFVGRIGIAGALEKAGKRLHWQAAADLALLDPPVRVRRALEELGPTFVKLGQILATRVDLFGPEWIAEFSQLQDAAPSVPYEQIEPQLTEDLGRPPEEIFAWVDTQPLAAASLAQVHRARLQDGTEVVLKIRRPGIKPVVDADMRLLTRIAQIVDAEAPELRRFRPRELARQLTQSLRRELDFSAEARSAERIAANFSGQPDIVIPRIHWAWTGARINVQDLIVGIAGRHPEQAAAAGLDRALLARRGANAVLKMMLEDGYFHADPHQGNVLYLPGNRIAFIDFGMIGRVSDERRYQLAVLLYGLVNHQSQKVADILTEWSLSDESDRATELVDDLDAFVDQFHGIPLRQLDLAAMLSEVLTILRDHDISLPADLALLIKAFITLVGMGRQLDPGFDMASEAKPFLERVLMARNSPGALAKRGWHNVSSTANLIGGLPDDLRQLMRAARKGRLHAQIEVLPLEQAARRLDRAISRLTAGIVAAALIVGSAIVMTADREPALPGMPSFGMLGFLGAVAIGIWLLVSIWRSGKR